MTFAAIKGSRSGENADANRGQSRVEPKTIHGMGGVVITAGASGPGAPGPSRLSADTVVAELAAGGSLSSLSGKGHAAFDQQTAAGVHQSSNSDELEVQFAPVSATGPGKGKANSENAEIASIVQTGNVVLIQDAPATHAGSSNKVATATGSPLRATANRSEYDGKSQILHLSGAPRLRDGSLDMTANQMEFARATGDAFAHGDVKASWVAGAGHTAQVPGASLLAGGSASAGGSGPVHAVAAEAELHQATQEVIFRGSTAGGSGKSLPRIWQGANSIGAPLITLNRQKQTLVAVGTSAANPVRTVLVSSPQRKSASSLRVNGKAGNAVAKSDSDAPSVIRLKSGDLRYSEGERYATLHGGPAGNVTAETVSANGPATVVSQEADVRLLPAGVHAAARNGADQTANASPASASVDELTARGHVTVDWPERRGVGEKLVYLSEEGTFTLTGTGASPPRITDQARGTVTGSALIFHSRDDSVTVEGNGGKTVTETQSPK